MESMRLRKEGKRERKLDGGSTRQRRNKGERDSRTESHSERKGVKAKWFPDWVHCGVKLVKECEM